MVRFVQDALARLGAAGQRPLRPRGAARSHAGRRRLTTRRAPEDPPTFVLKLYISGSTPRATRAIENLQRICEQELRGEYELVIIDVLEQPQLAEDDKILATPTLIKQLPPPLRRVIGDLSDSEKVLLGLGLEQRKEGAPPSRSRAAE